MAERALTVMQVLPALDGGGVERGTLEVARELVRRGHRSLVISAGGRMVAELERDGSEHIAWPIGVKSLLTLRFVSKLRRLLAERRVDILHARSRLPAWIAYLAWRGMDPAKRPHFITTVHGLYSVNRYSAIMTRGERVIAVSDTVKDYILANYPEVDPARIKVIHRGVDPSEFPFGYKPSPEWLARWYAQYPQLKDKFIITLPGRLTRLKGHEEFIELMARLKASGQSVHGLIVGGEDPRRRAYAEELRRVIAARGLDGTITFTGQRADMRDIYAASNLVLSLSTKPESFGRTVLEALSLGVPVIGYDHGGVGEILDTVFPNGAIALGDLTALAARIGDWRQTLPTIPMTHPYTLSNMLNATLGVYAAVS